MFGKSKTFIFIIISISEVFSIISGVTNTVTDNTTHQTHETSSTSDPLNNSDPSSGGRAEFYNNIHVEKYSETLIWAKTGSTISLKILGLVGNSLSILVTIKQGLIRTGVWVHIMCLAISDNCVLVMSMLMEFSMEPVNYWGHFLNNNNLICKLFYTCFPIFVATSHTILAFMTISRSIMIVNPYKKPAGQKMAFTMVACIIIYVMVVYVSYGIVVLGVASIPTGMVDPLTGQPITIKLCSALPRFEKYHEYLVWADMLVLFIIPAMSIIIANIAIIVTLVRRSRNKSIQRDNSRVQNDSRINYMLVFVSSYFVISVSPMIIYVNFLIPYVLKDPINGFAYDNVAWTIITYLNTTNYVGNFFMYCLTGQIFREETKKFLQNIFKCDQHVSNVQNPRFEFRAVTASTTSANRSMSSN